jgi:hypothetical protein
MMKVSLPRKGLNCDFQNFQLRSDGDGGVVVEEEEEDDEREAR